MLIDLGSGVGSGAEAGSGDEFGSGEPSHPKSLPAPVPTIAGGHTPTSTGAGTGAPDEPQCTATEGVLHCWMTGCTAMCFSEVGAALLMLFIAGMAANTFGNLLSGFAFPAITTFLFFGIVLGPYGTNVVTVQDSKKLLWCAPGPPLCHVRSYFNTSDFSLFFRRAVGTPTCH